VGSGWCVLTLWGTMMLGPVLARSWCMCVVWWFYRHRGCGGLGVVPTRVPGATLVRFAVVSPRVSEILPRLVLVLPRGRTMMRLSLPILELYLSVIFSGSLLPKIRHHSR